MTFSGCCGRQNCFDDHEENEGLLHRYLQKEVVMQQLLAIGEISRMIGIARHRIEYAVSNGAIPEPKVRVANKRAFSRVEVQNIADYFGVNMKLGDDAEDGGK